MKLTNIYGLSRTRDKKGKIVGREFKDFVMCIHPSAGGGQHGCSYSRRI